MLRHWITLDGEVMASEEWRLKPTDLCFWCDQPLILIKGTPCYSSQGNAHDFVTVCDRR